MKEAAVLAMIQAHFAASSVSEAGEEPDDDIARASEIYAEDAVVEWPQGGERVYSSKACCSAISSPPWRRWRG
jgi:hypothetical protein